MPQAFSIFKNYVTATKPKTFTPKFYKLNKQIYEIKCKLVENISTFQVFYSLLPSTFPKLCKHCCSASSDL